MAARHSFAILSLILLNTFSTPVQAVERFHIRYRLLNAAKPSRDEWNQFSQSDSKLQMRTPGPSHSEKVRTIDLEGCVASADSVETAKKLIQEFYQERNLGRMITAARLNSIGGVAVDEAGTVRYFDSRSAYAKFLGKLEAQFFLASSEQAAKCR